MISDFFIQIVLLVTIFAQLSLIGLLLSSQRHAFVRWVIIILATTCVIWPAGILAFIVQTDNVELAAAIAKIYYIDGALIGALLVVFAHVLPYRRPISLNLKLWLVGIVAIITTIVLVPNGMIQSVYLSTDYNWVELHPILYIIYVVFFSIVIAITMTLLAKGYRTAIKAKQYQIAAQTRTLIAGMAVALAFGFWFNILLPFWGDYSLVWAGPPFTLLFVVAMFYAIMAQGLFDLRAALARSSAYLMLLFTMVAGYAIIVFTITNVFFDTNNQRATLITYVLLALFFTITYPPVKKFFDYLTYRLFYHDDYDLKESLADITEVTSEELKLERLVRRSLEILQSRLVPEYISAYIIDDDGRVRHFTVGPKRPTPHQRKLQIEVVGTVLDRLPRVLDAHDRQVLDDTGAQQQISRADVSMILQFVVQGEHVGALFLGDKQNGTQYNDKDLQLLGTATDELALAIQNSQRFEEIEHFNDTLQSRVDSATKRLRHTNQELKKLDRAKNEFVSLASHQLRTPLTSIKGYLSMVLEGDTGKINTAQRKVLEQAFASSEKMVHLIGEFLSVSRLQTNKFNLELESADLNRLVEQVVATMQPIAAEHRVKLSFDGVVGKRLTEMDVTKMQLVIMNYIDNAIFYSPVNGKVSVALDYSDKEAVMTVVDSGIGVPKKEQAGLFGKFYRASNARKKRPDGTGIGLFLAKKIVTAHGGSVIFHSKEGKGSTFGFRLPSKDIETKK